VDAPISRVFVINVTDVASPSITSSNTVSNAENAVLAHTLTANESVTWSIVGGADQVRFEVSGSTLRWASNGTKNFESPNDANTDNAYVVQVLATSVATGETSTQTITVTVTNVNEAPTVANAIPDQSATEDSAFSFQFASNAFADVDAGTTLTYTATKSDNSALPAWLTFTPSTRTFSGTPAGGDVGTLSVKVTASDGSLTVSDTFDIVVSGTHADDLLLADGVSSLLLANGTDRLVLAGPPFSGHLLDGSSTVLTDDSGNDLLAA
jgi:hypothetical protein